MKLSEAILPALLVLAFGAAASCEVVTIDPTTTEQKDTISVIVVPPEDTSIVIPIPVDTTVADTTEVTLAKTVSLLFSEASESVKGYGNPTSFKNEGGTWTICAYRNNNMQLNTGKVSYIGTPMFDSDITLVYIVFASSYTDNIMLCTECGDKTATGVLASAKAAGSTAEISLTDVSARQVFIRSAACARISEVYVTYGGKDSSPDTGGDDPDDDEEEVPGDDPVETVATTGAKWFELPVVNDADHNGIDDNNTTLYYASHSFSMGSKQMRNYTVCYSGDHHCPVWVAAPRHECYTGSTGRTNAYRQDPSIPSGIQSSSKETGGGCNKGHMLGSVERTCSSDANRQVFYYTNIAPQLSAGFNTGGGGWNLLEDWVDTKVCRDTLYEVIGCYFDTYTDGYGNTVGPKVISFGGRSDVDMPTMFYYVLLRTKKGTSGKSVKDCSASELQCAAFVRSHTNSLKGQKPSSREMMSVSDLEKITGITYFPNIPNAPKSTFSSSDWGL